MQPAMSNHSRARALPGRWLPRPPCLLFGPFLTASVGAWNHWYRRQIARRQWLCRLVAAALRRPRLVRTAVTLLAHAPLFAAPALRYLQRSRLKTLGHSGLG